MHRLASGALHGEPWKPVDSLLAEIEAVTAEAVAEVSAEYLDPARQTILRLGPKT
jgi:predicted Zn-dependent peptidase